MNFIQNIADELGVKIGEVFKLKFPYGVSTAKYRLSDKGLERYREGEWQCNCHDLFRALLCKQVKIKKLVYIPKIGETYYTFVGKDWLVDSACWMGFAEDYSFLKSGMVFETIEEAKAARAKIYEKLVDERWNDGKIL